MLPALSKRLPSVVAAHLQSPAALPAISVAASKIASTFALDRRPLLQSRTKSAASTASAVHDESSMFDSYYLHDAKNSSSLLHPCGDVHPEKFFPEEPSSAHAAASTISQSKLRDHRQEKVCPHSDLTHLEDPYHQYAYYPKLVSDLTTVSRLLDRHGHGRKDVLTSIGDVTRNFSPKFNIVRDDAERTVIEVDVTSYRPEDVTAQLENENVLLIQGIARGGNHDETKRFAKKFVLDNVDEEGVTATIEDGLLTIGLPKLGTEKIKVKNIPIV